LTNSPSARESQDELLESALWPQDAAALEFDVCPMNCAEANDESSSWISPRLLLEFSDDEGRAADPLAVTRTNEFPKMTRQCA